MRFQAVIRSRPRSTWIIAIAALAVAAPVTAGDVGPAPIDALRAATVQGLERSQVRGASLALIRGGRLVWTESFGIVDERSGELVDNQTVFEAASLGKVVSAVAALTLVAEGRWRLEMPVRSPSLEVPEGCSTPTLAHLLSHSAGLSNDLGATRFRAGCRPGIDFSYAGQGYTVLQEMLENETGEPAERFIEHRVFRPLGMEHSTFCPRFPRSIARPATSTWSSHCSPARRGDRCCCWERWHSCWWGSAVCGSTGGPGDAGPGVESLV